MHRGLLRCCRQSQAKCPCGRAAFVLSCTPRGTSEAKYLFTVRVKLCASVRRRLSIIIIILLYYLLDLSARTCILTVSSIELYIRSVCNNIKSNVNVCMNVLYI